MADPWQLRQTSESCYIDRTFSTGAGTVQLIIQSFGPNSLYHFILKGPNLPSDKQRARAVRVAFGGEDMAKDAVALIGKAGSDGMVLLMVSPPHPTQVMYWFYSYTPTRTPIVVPLDTTAENLFVGFPGKPALTLSLGPMASEYAALDECAAKIAREWNLDASNGKRAVFAPQLLRGSDMAWQVNYPANLLLNRVNGVVELRMKVDEGGRVQGCTVQMVTWTSQFGDDACEKLTKWARFEPARDSAGNPVPALFRTSGMYVIYDW